MTGGNSLTLFEVNQAAAIIKETAHPDVNLIFGAVIDPNMNDELRVTVIATGFDHSSPMQPATLVDRARDPQTVAAARPVSRPAETPAQGQRPAQPGPTEFQARVLNTDDLDIPAFLRNRQR